MKKFFFKLFIIVLIFFCFLSVSLYFVFSSPYFFRTYLLPAISNATGIKITAEEIFLSNFSTKVKLKNYSVKFNSDMRLDGKFASFSYDFWSLIYGDINIEEFIFDKAKISIRSEKQYQYKSHGLSKEVVTESGKNGVDFNINIKKIEIRDSILEYKYRGSESQVNIGLNDISISALGLGSNKKSKINYNFSLMIESNGFNKIDVDKVRGSLEFTTEKWKIISIETTALLEEIVGHTNSNGFDYEKLALNLNLKNDKSSSFKINKFSLTDLSKKKNNSIEVNLNGYFSLSPLNFLIKVSDIKIPSDILNVFGSFYDISFEKTSLSLKESLFQYIENELSFNGDIKLNNFSFAKSNFNCLGNYTVDLRFTSELCYNLSENNFNINKLSLALQENETEILNLEIKEEFNINWNKDICVNSKSESAKADLRINNLKLELLESILCRNFRIQSLKGALDTNLVIVIKKNNLMSLIGYFDISDGGCVYKKLHFDKIDMKQTFDLSLNSLSNLIINASETILSADSYKVLNCKTNGNINIIDEKGNLFVKLNELCAKGLNKLPYSPAGMLGIKGVNINGEIFFDYNSGGENFSVQSKLQGGGLEFYLKKDAHTIPPIHGNMEFSIAKNNSELEFKKYICNLNMPEGRLGNLAANGKIFLYGAERSKINLYSEGIRLKELITAFNSIAGNFNINFDNINLNTKLVLKDIEFGKYLVFDCESEVNIGNGILNADPILIIMNGNTILGKIVYDFKAKENNYFNFAANASNIEINPILKTFDHKIYLNSNGIISSFSMNIEGRGFSRIDLIKDLKGNLSFVCKDILLPDNPERNNYIRLLFIPIEVIAQINELFGNVNIPIFFNNLVKYSKDIFSQMKDLDLKYGIVALVAKNGKINFNQCIFKGNGNPINWLKFKGSLGLDKSVNLTSRMKLSNYLIFPLHISGTVSSPKPNMFDFVNFIKEQIYISMKSGTQELIWLPESIFEKICYDSDILFQSIIP